MKYQNRLMLGVVGLANPLPIPSTISQITLEVHSTGPSSKSVTSMQTKFVAIKIDPNEIAAFHVVFVLVLVLLLVLVIIVVLFASRKNTPTATPTSVVIPNNQ